MNKVSAEAVAHSKNLSFTFSGNLRDENVNLDAFSGYTFIIDVNGTVYQGSNATDQNATVLIIGGVDEYIFSKATSIVSNFFLTEQQKITLYKILRELSKFTNTANISSDNAKLEQAITSLYSNYCA